MDFVSNYLINVAGIPTNTVILLFTLPFLATLIGTFRYIIGLRTFNLYPHLILTYIFFQLSINQVGSGYDQLGGIKYGLFIVVFTLLCTSIIKAVTNRINMHFIPKKALIISFICLCLLTSLVFASLLYRSSFINVDLIVLLMIIVIAEEYLSMYTKRGFIVALKMSLGTLALSIGMFLLITYDKFQSLILSNSWIIVVVILLNFFIGKYLGLRITEYFRFRNLLEDDTDISTD